MKKLNQADYKAKIIDGPFRDGKYTKAKFECIECQNEYTMRVSNARRSLGMCKNCTTNAQKKKLTVDLKQEDFTMKIIKDLGMKRTASGKLERKAIFECTKCNTHFEARATGKAAKNQTKCKKCADANTRMHSHKLYPVWNGIIQRCYSKKCKDFSRYGGIGVTVCDQWKDDPAAFITWCVNNGWKHGMHVDKDIKSRMLGISPAIYSPETITFVTPSKNVRESHRDLEIQQFSLDGKHIATYQTPIDAAEALGYKDSNLITAVARGTNKTSKSFIWKYTKDLI